MNYEKTKALALELSKDLSTPDDLSKHSGQSTYLARGGQ